MAFYLYLKQEAPMRYGIDRNISSGETLIPLSAAAKKDAKDEALALLDEKDAAFQLSAALLLQDSDDLLTHLTTKRTARERAKKEAQYEALKLELGK